MVRHAALFLTFLALCFVGVGGKVQAPAASTSISAPPTTTRNDYFFNLDTIQKIGCITFPPGVASTTDLSKLTPEQWKGVHGKTGTGTIIGHNRILTAQHVVDGANLCVIDHHVARISYEDKKLDVAVLDADLGDTAVSQISCDGYTKDAGYWAVGYAWGQDFAIQALRFTGEYSAVRTEGETPTETVHYLHMGIFSGSIFSGMSGGPILGPDGRVYGIVNDGTESESAFRSLRDTPLCVALGPAQVPHK